MSGETSLRTLIKTMNPQLDDRIYAFAVIGVGDDIPGEVDALMTFQEAEGVTIIAPQAALEAAGLEPSFICQRIVLSVHSALEAVGLTAAVSSALADIGISANIVAAAFHDHLFVPKADAERALSALKALSAGAAEPLTATETESSRD
ncbi:MAG: ACT domain-containing protein [Pseudomonadota bacterium]